MAQFRKYGIVYFILSYYYFFFKVGYHNNPYEIEARRLSNTNNSAGYLQSVGPAILAKSVLYGEGSLTAMEQCELDNAYYLMQEEACR